MPATPPPDFEALYEQGAPAWEIGRAQAEIVSLAGTGEIRGDVLDVGCGTGENALHLAALGHAVVGIDASRVAVARAEEKARARRLPARFLVADVFDLRSLERSFATAIDVGLLHQFDAPERRAYARSLAGVLQPGAGLHVLCYSDAEPPGPVPRRLGERELRESFEPLFALANLRQARFENRVQRGGARAWLASFTRLP